MILAMWWVVGGVVALAAVRWFVGRNQPIEPSERIQRAYAALRRRKRVTIAAAKDGPVLIRGTVSQLGERVASPLTGRACVFYDARIISVRDPSAGAPPGSDEESPATSSLVKLNRRVARPFLITDETGTARVDLEAEGDVCLVDPAKTSSIGEDREALAHFRQVLVDLGVDAARVAGAEESAIFVGDEVTVAGVGRHEMAVDGDAAGHRSPPTRYVVRASRDAVLAIARGTLAGR